MTQGWLLSWGGCSQKGQERSTRPAGAVSPPVPSPSPGLCSPVTAEQTRPGSSGLEPPRALSLRAAVRTPSAAPWPGLLRGTRTQSQSGLCCALRSPSSPSLRPAAQPRRPCLIEWVSTCPSELVCGFRGAPPQDEAEPALGTAALAAGGTPAAPLQEHPRPHLSHEVCDSSFSGSAPTAPAAPELGELPGAGVPLARRTAVG